MNLVPTHNIFSVSQKPLAVLVVVIFLSNLIFAYALLPAKTANAQWVNTRDIQLNPLHIIWKAIQTAFDKITSWASNVSALIDMWFKQKTIMTELVRWIIQQLLYKLLAMVSNDIIKWINGGQAQVKFVANWENYLYGAAFSGGQRFVQTMLGQGLMCQPYQQQIQRIFSRPYSFARDTACSPGGGVTDVTTWEEWDRLAYDNFYIRYSQTLDEYRASEERAKEDALYKALSGNGFLPPENCRQWRVENMDTGEWDITTTKPNVSGAEWLVACIQQNIATPSSVLSNETNQVVDSGRSLVQQQIAAMTPHLNILGLNMTPWLTSIFTSLINRLIQTGLGLLTGIGSGGDDYYYYRGLTGSDNPLISTTTPGTITREQAEEDVAASPILVRHLRLLKEALDLELLPQAQREDTLNAQIRDVQRATLNGLLEIVKLIDQGYINCSLPVWAIKTTASQAGNATTTISAGSIGQITYTQTFNQMGTVYNIVEIVPGLAQSTAAANVEQRIAQTDEAIVAVEDYAVAAQSFIDFYDGLSFPLSDEDAAEVRARASELLEMRENTLILVQETTGSTATTFEDLLSEVQDETINTIDEAGLVRNSIIPELEGDLQTAQQTLANIEAIRNACQPPPPPETPFYY